MKQKTIYKKFFILEKSKTTNFWAWLTKKRIFKLIKIRNKKRRNSLWYSGQTGAYCSGPGSAPGQGTMIQALWHSPQNKIRQEGITIKLS